MKNDAPEIKSRREKWSPRTLLILTAGYYDVQTVGGHGKYQDF